MRKGKIGLLLLAVFVITGRVPAQEQRVKVAGGHELGETAEQFFAEGQEKEVLDECVSGNFKGVNKLIKREAKRFCDQMANTRQLAMRGNREEYQSSGEPSEMRKDTFTFEGGHLVKVELLYTAPSAEFNYRGQTFEKIFNGAKQSYGSPTSESTKPTQDTYGVPYVAHREIWVMPHAAILIDEKPGPGGSTTVIAFTREEYEHSIEADAPKPPNPLE